MQKGEIGRLPQGEHLAGRAKQAKRRYHPRTRSVIALIAFWRWCDADHVDSPSSLVIRSEALADAHP